MQKVDQDRSRQQCDDITRNPASISNRHHNQQKSSSRQQRRPQRRSPSALDYHAHPPDKVAWNRSRVQAEEILDLGAGNQDRDAVGESHHDRTRDELYRCSQTRRAQDDQHHPGHHRADQQPIEAIARQDAKDDDDKRPSRPADLIPRSAQSGDCEPRDNCGIQAGFRWRSSGDGKGHCQRQRHQAHCDSRKKIGAELLRRVVTQREDGFRRPFRKTQRHLPQS